MKVLVWDCTCQSHWATLPVGSLSSHSLAWAVVIPYRDLASQSFFTFSSSVFISLSHTILGSALPCVTYVLFPLATPPPAFSHFTSIAIIPSLSFLSLSKNTHIFLLFLLHLSISLSPSIHSSLCKKSSKGSWVVSRDPSGCVHRVQWRGEEV